jgi:CheY-like chemotaxis protein
MGDGGGILTVGLHEIEFFERGSTPDFNIPIGKYLKLEVSDTGCGIDNKIIERIFDPYFSTKKLGEGTGLGLALVQAIVDDHNGFLEVDTKIDKGTNFSIYLPIIGGMTVPSASSKNEPHLLKGNEKIMFVDDEEFIRLTFKDFFGRYGYKVSAFENGYKALKEFKKAPGYFDLVVTDMAMPKVSGNELARELLTIRPDLPIILCTGYSEKMTEIKAKEIGIKKYIQKPVTNINLVIAAREILDKQ